MNVLNAIKQLPLPVRRRPSPWTAAAVLHTLFDHAPGIRVAIQLWDGQRVSFGTAPDVTLRFRDPETFIRCFGTGDPSEFAEGYVDGRIEVVSGSIAEAIDLVFDMRKIDVPLSSRLAVRSALGVPESRHTVGEDQRDVRAHYDQAPGFFQLFLDGRLVYSCAYFATPDTGLEDAQARKLDLVCRKLQLGPDDYLLDVGCGWGALPIWAASRYRTRAHGITLSRQQADEARRRVAAAGLDDLVTIDVADYRSMPEGTFSKVSSVGMYEHVGLARLDSYLGVIKRSLRPGGLFLNHGITIPDAIRDRTGGAFIGRHVFPGGELESAPNLQSRLQGAGFDVIDVHALRPHYVLTLAEWSRRFQRRRREAVALTSERVARVWEVYLAGCAKAFERGLVGVHQILAGLPDESGRLPSTLQRCV